MKNLDLSEPPIEKHVNDLSNEESTILMLLRITRLQEDIVRAHVEDLETALATAILDDTNRDKIRPNVLEGRFSSANSQSLLFLEQAANEMGISEERYRKLWSYVYGIDAEQ